MRNDHRPARSCSRKVGSEDTSGQPPLAASNRMLPKNKDKVCCGAEQQQQQQLAEQVVCSTKEDGGRVRIIYRTASGDKTAQNRTGRDGVRSFRVLLRSTDRRGTARLESVGDGGTRSSTGREGSC